MFEHFLKTIDEKEDFFTTFIYPFLFLAVTLLLPMYAIICILGLFYP